MRQIRTNRTVRHISSRDTVLFARQQRKEATVGEGLLWAHLRNRRLGFRFHRQHPLDGFVLDFYCPEAKLAIEIDGPQHEEQKDYDRWREEIVASRGIRFLRISDDVMQGEIEYVLEVIRQALAESSNG